MCRLGGLSFSFKDRLVLPESEDDDAGDEPADRDQLGRRERADGAARVAAEELDRKAQDRLAERDAGRGRVDEAPEVETLAEDQEDRDADGADEAPVEDPSGTEEREERLPRRCALPPLDEEEEELRSEEPSEEDPDAEVG